MKTDIECKAIEQGIKLEIIRKALRLFPFAYDDIRVMRLIKHIDDRLRNER